jgi:two-component system response regulator HydG
MESLNDADNVLDIDDLTEDLQAASTPGPMDGPSGSDSLLVGKPLRDIEGHYISETLKSTEGNGEEAARRLNIGERTRYRKLKEYQVG